MLKRLSKASFKDYWYFMTKKYPVDIWEFETNELRGRVVNEWENSVSRLFINDVEVDFNNELFAVKGDKPSLVYTSDNNHIEIYFRAILFVKIKVKINGKFLNNSFI
jgi:hypothetical protein